MNLKLTIALALSFGALVVAGCGFGEPTAEGKISERTTDHLNALVNGEYAEACGQLSARALGRLGGPAGCREALRGSYGRELKDAALDIDVDGTRATATSCPSRSIEGRKFSIPPAGPYSTGSVACRTDRTA